MPRGSAETNIRAVIPLCTPFMPQASKMARSWRPKRCDGTVMEEWRPSKACWGKRRTGQALSKNEDGACSPSPPAEGGEGRGEEDQSGFGRLRREQWDPPLPARSSRGEVGWPAAFAVSSVFHSISSSL